MRRLIAKHLGSQRPHSTSNNPDRTPSEQPRPERSIYYDLPTATSIRVLVVAPGSPHADITCFFSICDLETDFDPDNSGFQQRYTALSYVWGGNENPAYITVEGRPKRVTRNLYDALRSLRRQGDIIVLWVDAVCINQDDPEEKKVQIGLMGQVYKQADRVFAYVPQEPEDIDPFDRLSYKIFLAGTECSEMIGKGAESNETTLIADAIDLVDPEDETGHASHDTRIRTKMVPFKPTGTCIEDYDLPHEEDPVWITWRRFYASPYFRRIWILQEFVLAKDLYIHNGTSMRPFVTYFCAMQFVERYSRLMNLHYLGRGENAALTRAAQSGWNGLDAMLYERGISGPTPAVSRLIDKMPYAFKFDATDPRDKIFALLGLVSDAERFEHLVSYHPEDAYPKVYVRFAKAFTEQGHLFSVLRMACRTLHNAQLPSWVPDWSTPTTVPKPPNVGLREGYRAGGDSITVASSFMHNHLVLSGQIVSQIIFMTPSARTSTLPGAAGSRVQDTLETLVISMNQLAEFHKQNHLEDFSEAVFSCLTAQIDTLDSIPEGDVQSSGLIKDWDLYMGFNARMSEYLKIKDHATRKVTIGALAEDDKAFLDRVMYNMARRCFCVTGPDMRIGLVPDRAELGDHLAIIKGAPVPFVLRDARGSSKRDGNVYNLIGDAYVWGMMRGECVPKEDSKWQEIVLA